MCTRKYGTLVLGLAATLALFETRSQPSLGLGEPISQEDLAPWAISVQPDGAGLPPGSGSVADGEALYAAKCQTCHGAEGAGQPHDRLVGGQDTLDSLAQVRTIGSYWPYASTVFDYVRRAMPFNEPQSLNDNEVYAVTAYLLFLNGIVDADAVMNARTLARIRMPNEDGFIVAYPTKPQ
jgi:cytochrome c